MNPRFRVASNLANRAVQVIDAVTGAVVHTPQGRLAEYPSVSEAYPVARAENAAAARAARLARAAARPIVPFERPMTAPVTQDGYRLADTSIADMALLGRIAQVLVHDRDLGIVRRARVRALTEQTMRIAIGEDEVLLSPIDDDPDPLAYRHFTDAGRRFWLLMVTR